MPDATEIEMILCQAACFPHVVSSDDLDWYMLHITTISVVFTCAAQTLNTHTYTHRSNEHIMAIDTQALELCFVKYLKQTLPPPISSGGQERLANESQKPLIGV